MTQSAMRQSLLSCAVVLAGVTSTAVTADEAAVSYYQQIRPIFQSHCQGCHQPAKQSGAYVMTDVTRLLQGGESETAAVVPGKPDESYLMELITPADGEAAMPKGKPALSQPEIELIRMWIQSGAADDTPENAREKYDTDHPPVYFRQPIVTSIDYSPDGSLLAISGFHEVLLHRADGSGLVARLIGLSARVESISFSPDGRRLAVTGGLPERTGEVQIWDVENRELVLSIPLTYDTVYGASWSPDGSMIAVGCTDSTVRGFSSESGEQVFFSGAHNDWALDTVFSADGSHLVSVGRDMTTKLYNVPTQRFIDNLTSITPGALKGGIGAIARHPDRDEVLFGGSDGTPRIYRMHRQTKRVIGDDANLVRRFPVMRGRIHSVDFAADGKSIACASSLDGKGQVFVYTSEYESEISEEFKKILEKQPRQWNGDERKSFEDYVTAGIEVVMQAELPTAVYAVKFTPDGSTIAAAGADGVIRFLNPADGSTIRKLNPVEIDASAAESIGIVAADTAAELDALSSSEKLPEGRTLAAIEVSPNVARLNGPWSYQQLLVTGILDTGDRVDVTRMSQFSLSADAGLITPAGQIRAGKDGAAAVVVQSGEHVLAVPVIADGTALEKPVSYVRDVMPVISRLGCNGGTCHGAKDGKEGFKLSLRGYDPIYDVRAWTDDLKARRINLASPDNSLLLLKATGAVPHIAGQLTTPGSKYYQILRRWIAEGAKLDLDGARVVGIELEPQNPVVQTIGARQQMRVIATYSDGTTNDVTAESFLSSGNMDIAAVNRAGVVTTLRRGEAPVLARFEGAYAATTITAMGDRTGFEWEQPESWGRIDELVADKWERMKIRPTAMCTDAEYVRRIYLDLTGLPPAVDQVKAFLADERESKIKRVELVDQLIGSEAYVTYWTNKWADLLQVNSKFLAKEGATAFRDWIRGHVEQNTPYDKFCHEILTANGSNKDNPAASYYKILREPDALMENTTHLFLAVRFNCNKCHDHPFERWTQDQYYETAAFFARVGLKKDDQSGDKTIGGTAVEGAKPLYEIVFDKDEGEVKHDRTGDVTAPAFPYDVSFAAVEGASRREKLADWITSPNNEYFVRSYVNRIWGYMLGTGLIEPLDDVRAGNPASNPELLEYLANRFVESGFNVRDLTREIVTSRTYQLSVSTNEWNEDDHLNFSHAKARRLPAEVLYDTIYAVTGAKMNIPGVAEGTRAAALADAATKLPDGFLATLGRPVRESACECERSSELQLGPVMALMNGPTVSNAISDSENAIAKLLQENDNDDEVIDEIFLRILNRPARPEEIQATLEIEAAADDEHKALVQKLAEYTVQIEPESQRREKARETAIASATAELESFRTAKEAELLRLQQEETARLTSELAQFDEMVVPSELAGFQSEYLRSSPWIPLQPGDLTSDAEAKLTTLPDHSVLADRRSTVPVKYTVSADVQLTRITAVRLEMLTHASIGSFGPGFADDGNFVLTEFTGRWAPTSNGDKPAMDLVFGKAEATLSQSGFPVTEAIDNERKMKDNGWAIAGGAGQTQSAVFHLNDPLKLTEPVTLTFVLEQLFREHKYNIGRFRISVTDDPSPALQGVPQDIDRILAMVEAARTEAQNARLLDWFRGRSVERQQKVFAVEKSKRPQPKDPGIIERENELELVSQPLAQDPLLARLERAAKLSAQQLVDRRTTMAQDLAWALVNSPSFLFNR
jgi:WD40 repeat protein/mono/diheme cytochrome c family protein